MDLQYFLNEIGAKDCLFFFFTWKTPIEYQPLDRKLGAARHVDCFMADFFIMKITECEQKSQLRMTSLSQLIVTQLTGGLLSVSCSAEVWQITHGF